MKKAIKKGRETSGFQNIVINEISINTDANRIFLCVCNSLSVISCSTSFLWVNASKPHNNVKTVAEAKISIAKAIGWK